jgi:hypothetical protein
MNKLPSLARMYLNLSDDLGEKQLMHNEMYEISVDCTLPINDMVLAGHYENQEEFLKDIHSSALIVEGTGQYKAIIHLVEIKVVITDNVDADWYLRKKNLRVARIEEILALGALYPLLQQQANIAGRARSSHGDFDPTDPNDDPANDPIYQTVFIGSKNKRRIAEVESLPPILKLVCGHEITPYKWACVPV